METSVETSAPRPFSSLPELPGAKPVAGHLPMIRDERMAFLRLGAESPHPMLRLAAPLGNVALVTVPELFHEVLVERHADYQKSAMMRFALGPIANEGLFTSSGELWRRQRKLMAPLFHQSALKTYADDMILCARRAVDGWRDGERVEFAKEATRITMAIAGRTLFDADTYEDTERLGHAITVALDWGNDVAGGAYSLAHVVPSFALLRAADHLPAGLAEPARALSSKLEKPLFFPGAEGRALREALDVLEGRVREMIALRRAQGLSRPDLLSRLLAAKDDETGAGMSDQQVRDELLTLFIAGHETTATGLSWSLDLLCRHPAWYARAEAEADALGHEPTVDDLPRLQTILRVFKEALRLYPPAYFFGRTALRETQLGGYTVPRFTNVLLCPWVLHHNPRVWEDPERFDPDRFLPEAEAARHKTAWAPFSAGPRVCIGNHFSMMEAQLVLALLLQRVRFEALEHPEPDPSATLRPKGTLPMRVTLRAR